LFFAVGCNKMVDRVLNEELYKVFFDHVCVVCGLREMASFFRSFWVKRGIFE
jgi:hypothetical protein